MIGNPPFLGGKLLRSVLGNDYVERLFAAYAGRVPAEADLVVYWFAKAWERMSSLSAPGGGEGRGEVGDSRVPADQPTSPSRASGAGPDNAHRELDATVAAAYGWPAAITEEDALARLLDLNRERAAAEP